MACKVNSDVKLEMLHPLLQHKIEAFFKKCDNLGYGVGISCGYRSFDEQNKLYAQGRTEKGSVITNARGGYSQHNFGWACDIYRNEKGHGAYDDSDGWFKKVAKVAKSVGLCWGGDWKSFQDKPHFYIGTYGDTTEQLRTKFGTYERFKSTWKKTVAYKTGIRMWKGKNIVTKVLTKIPNGKCVDVLFTSKFWWSKVKFGGKVGYVKKKYLV